MKEIYLDNSATTKPLTEVIEYVKLSLEKDYGNPSSLHNKGLKAEKIMKKARQEISKKLYVKPEEVYFTSGGTEGNNLAIKGIVYQFQNRGKHLITTKIEHSSVLDTFKALENEGFKVTYLKPDDKGIISLKDLENAITPETILVSIMHVNNELGSIQPIQEAGKIIKEKNRNTFFHVDGVQSFGKILTQPKKWNIDLFTISGHKIHAPKGVGALYIKKGTVLKPLFNGGGQENGVRSGTENVPGIAGLIPAVQALPQFSMQNQRNGRLDELREYFLSELEEILPQVRINTPNNNCAPHIINLSVAGAKGEIFVHALENEGIYVSTGSACHSKNKEENKILKSIGLPAEYLEGTIRISLSEFNTKEELSFTVKKMAEQIELYF